ncbi:MAG: alpha-amylase family glycosyl hydrolase, partial [Bacilli bacterium]
MKKSYLPIFILLFTTLTACGRNSSSSTSSVSSSLPPISINPNYEQTMTWAEPEHLYIHYNRSKENQQAAPADYANWGIWIWQKAPLDLPGVLIDWSYYDESGAIAAIDFSKVTQTNIGKVIAPNQTWEDITRIGFLIVFKPSMANVVGMWTSDGGTYMYINDFNTQIRQDNTMHLFTLTGQVADYTFNYQGGVGEDPYANDTGQFVSLTNVSSSNLSAFPQAITSQDFYHHVGVGYQIFVRSFKAKEKDMRIVMDLVVNHTSMQNAWFQNSINLRKGTNSAGEPIDYRSFYHWRYSLTPLTAPWHRFGETNYYYYGKFASGMPELNYDYQGTRDAIIDVAKYWAGFGVSGFRIDAVKHIYMNDEVTKATNDDITEAGTEYAANRTKNINFFKEFNYRLKSVFPDAFVIGENFDGWDARIAPYYQGMDSQLDFQNYYHLMNMMHGIAESADPQAQASVFATKFNTRFKPVRNQFINGAFTSNHDVARVLNWVRGTPVGNDVVAAQTITTSTYADALKRAKAFNAATLLMPGTSWIYYGDELGMTGNWQLNPSGTDFHKDRYYRQPMKWDNLDTDPAH